MASSFWTNTVWYILLGFTIVVELVITLRRAENRRQTVAFYLTLAGMTLWLETLLLIFFKSYAYYPKIINDPAHWYDDVLAGNLFSQFSVAASMLMIAVMRLKFRWYVVLALAYGAVETLFVALGIYEQYWYRTCYTVLLLPFAFLLARRMHDRLCEGLRPIYYYAYVAFSLYALVVITLWWGFRLADIISVSERLLADPQISRYGLTVGLHIVCSTTLIWVYFSGMKWRIKALVFAVLEAFLFVVYRLGWMQIRSGWFLPVSASVLLWTYASIAMMDRLYGLGGITSLQLHRPDK